MSRSANIWRSSVKVSTASTSKMMSALAASPFLAMQGPTNTTLASGPCMDGSWMTRAMAIIGETIGASAGTRSGWYLRTNDTTAGHGVAM